MTSLPQKKTIILNCSKLFKFFKQVLTGAPVIFREILIQFWYLNAMYAIT